MFYEPKDGHPLPHNPFKACVAPRPIGWISTVDKNGVPNLAPYSFFNAVSDAPPIVMFSATGYHPQGGDKDSVANAVETGEFVFNLVSWAQKDAMNASSAGADHGVNEFELAGLDMLPSTLVKPHRVGGAPVHFECRTLQTLELPCTQENSKNIIVFGEVVGIHIDEEILTDGLIDLTKVQPVARLGYMDYAVVRETFQMKRPGQK